MLSLPAFFLSIKNVFVIVEYNDDPSRDPSGTKASISNALRCLPMSASTYSYIQQAKLACLLACPAGCLGLLACKPANQISQTGSLDTTAITRSISGLAFGTMPGNIMPLEPTKTRVIYYWVLKTKQLKDRNLEGSIICLPMFSSR